jgi:hypothetical protein
MNDQTDTQTQPNRKLVFSLLFDTIFWSIPTAFIVFLVWLLWSVSQDRAAINTAPFQKVTVSVTSKDSGEKLSIKSPGLPKKGDVIGVDQYTYGAVSTGDSVCK